MVDIAATSVKVKSECKSQGKRWDCLAPTEDMPMVDIAATSVKV